MIILDRVIPLSSMSLTGLPTTALPRSCSLPGTVPASLGRALPICRLLGRKWLHFGVQLLEELKLSFLLVCGMCSLESKVGTLFFNPHCFRDFKTNSDDLEHLIKLHVNFAFDPGVGLRSGNVSNLAWYLLDINVVAHLELVRTVVAVTVRVND